MLDLTSETDGGRSIAAKNLVPFLLLHPLEYIAIWKCKFKFSAVFTVDISCVQLLQKTVISEAIPFNCSFTVKSEG